MPKNMKTEKNEALEVNYPIGKKSMKKKKPKMSYMVWRLEAGNRCDYEFKSLLEAMDFVNRSIAKNYTDFELYVLKDGKEIFSSKSFQPEKEKKER